MVEKSDFSLSKLSVEKKSGRRENFSTEKLLTGISRAGTPFLIAKEISESIATKLAENPPIDDFIYSNKLREYITEELRQRNQSAIAESYSGYSKNQVTDLKEEQLKRNDKFDSKVSQAVNTHSKQQVKDKDIKSGFSP
ncbi:ATP cone domain-containing protein [Candidatus Nitrosocosmicus hydrocola]|uniref:ATP cone domain-containing protein n=1 Tax=Candidatus Nitrosocosmicus hydrocola TaxID=1826872 RepID=UPI0011E5930A|nr:ATP cone domain-containing protein [Candidatus Nitrosocosmicus hydrocola]